MRKIAKNAFILFIVLVVIPLTENVDVEPLLIDLDATQATLLKNGSLLIIFISRGGNG